MLTIPLEKLAYIIVKACEYDAEVPPVDEESGANPTDDVDRNELEETAENPTYQELVDAINGLSEPERIELLALTWLGRGDFSEEEWRDALREARRVHDEKETDYLIGTLIGHAAVSAQLDWCRDEGIRSAIFTHCGSQIVGGDERVLGPLVRRLGRERRIATRIAYDGLTVELGVAISVVTA